MSARFPVKSPTVLLIWAMATLTGMTMATMYPVKMNYRTRIISSLSDIGQAAWDELAALQPDANPFLSFAFLDALHQSGCASEQSGWQPQYLTLWRGAILEAAMPLYAKSHS